MRRSTLSGQKLDVMSSSGVKIELLTPHFFEGKGREECLADLYQSVNDLLGKAGASETLAHVLNRLPMVDWTLCEGVPGYVTIRLFAKKTPDNDLPSYVFEMVSRSLLGGRHVEIFTSQHVVFKIPEISTEEYLYLAMAIHVERQVELAELIATLPRLAPDLELGALAPEFAIPLMESLVPEHSADLARVRCDALRWLRRWDETPPADLVHQFPPFASALQSPFREVRSRSHLTTLFKRLTLLRKGVLRQWNVAPDQRAIRISLTSTQLQYPFGAKKVLSVCVAVSADQSWEILDEKVVQSALVEGVQVVEGSFFSYHPPKQIVRLLYFEVEKRDQSPLTKGEIAQIRQRLPSEIKASIGTLSHSLFMPRNEEEVLRGILVLSGEMRSKKALPQVVVSFEEIGVNRVTFTVILVRLLKGTPPTITQILDRLPNKWQVTLEQDRLVGDVRQIPKAASVFTVALPNKLFLRRDQSVDLNGARALLITELARLLPGLTDYHGGLLLKQEQILSEARKLTAGHLPHDEGLLESLFYSINPSIMQSYIQPRLIAHLFSEVVTLAQNSLDPQEAYQLTPTSGEGACILTACSRSGSLAAHLRGAIEALSFDPLQIAFTTATYRGLYFAICLYLSGDELGGERLKAGAMSALNEWKAEQQTRQILRLNIPRVESSLDPRIGIDRRLGIVIKMLYEGLMRVEEGGVVPGVAHSFSLSADQRTYTFNLRQSFWSNGDPVTSADFAYAWKKCLEPHFSSRYSHLFFAIKGAQAVKEGRGAIDDVGIATPSLDTLVVELNHPMPHFPELTSYWTYSPLHDKLDSMAPDWADARGQSFVCNGPFVVSAEERGRSLSLRKNPHYWACNAISLEGIEIFSIRDIATALALFKQGQIDWVGDPLIDISHKALGDALREKTIQSYPMLAVFWLELNTELPPFHSKAIRQAFAAVLDRTRLLAEVNTPYDLPSTSLFPPGMGLSAQPYPSNPDITFAKHQFERGCQEAHIDRDDFPPITLCYPQLAGREAIVEAVARQWREAFHIEIVVRGYPWEGYLDRMRRQDFHVAADTFVSWYHDPLYNLKPFSTATHCLNTTRWEQGDYTRFVTQAEEATDPEERRQAILAAERLILEEAAVIPISHRYGAYAVRPEVQGAFLSDIGQIDFSRTFINSGETS